MIAVTRDDVEWHYCRCGKWGLFGYGVALLKGCKGRWFCETCRPTDAELAELERPTGPTIAPRQGSLL